MKALLRAMVRTSGLLWLWRWWHRDAVIILTVHGVMDETTPHQWKPLRARLSPARLDRGLSVLRRHYRFVPLQDAVDMLAGRRPLQPYSMVLTFDDGYRNQVTHALPILRKHAVPATVFVSTGHVESRQPFWFDRLDYALQHADGDLIDATIGGHPFRIDARTREALDGSFAALRDGVTQTSGDSVRILGDIEALAARLEQPRGRRLSDVCESDPWTSLLSVEEIQSAQHEICFASHAVDHVRIHQLAHDRAADQLSRSRQALERWTGQPCRLLCYPDGGFDAEAARLARACGYEGAVTTRRGLNRRGDDVMTLRRFDLPDREDDTQILGQVSGLVDWARSFFP